MHSEYSLLDGAIRFSQALKLAREYRMPALAVTDHGNLFGAVSFYKQALEAGIKPIIGCEVYLAKGSRFDRTATQQGQEVASHLVLLAKDREGYRNLIKLVTAGYLEGFYYKPRIDRELLESHSQGLIAMSACLHGEIPRLLIQGRTGDAYDLAGWYKDLFEDRFYLELMDNGIDEQRRVNKELIKISDSLNIPLVATNDCHYLRKEEAKAHDVLLCIQTGKTLDEENRLKFQTNNFYFKSPSEMELLFQEVPEAVSNTLEVAERCNLDMEFGHFHFPRFPLPEGEGLDEHLERLIREGFKQRMEQLAQRDPSWYRENQERYRQRMEQELEIIKEMGFASYFLIVADFIDFARKSGIPVGPGRGSAAGSLVAYCLRITDIDPIRYNLLFERFLNPERRSMPDIDIDFCMLRRDEVIRYVARRYGEGNVAQITTFGKMMARAVVRDVGRVLGMPYDEVDRIAKLIPPEQKITLETAMEREPRLGQLANSDPRIAELLEIAKSLEGLTRHASTHAAGVVISDRPIVEYLPLYKSQKGEIVSQYDMKSIEDIGLIKFDFLGLRTLTMIHDTLELIKRGGRTLNIEELPLDDKETYALLSRGDTEGIFQLESSGMRELLMQLKPQSFEDLIALVALYRPGPLGSGMIEEFIARKHGRVPIQYELPKLEPILKDTYGIILYQEQVMQIASTLAGYTMGQADILRKAMGKKQLQVMEEQKQFFLEGARKNGIPMEKAERIFNQISEFGKYGFNKSHSAAYALVAYQTAYLKAHYPVEFFAALLTSEKDNTDKIIRHIGACRAQGIEVLPPDVNQSDWDFTVAEGKIRFGLGAIKNIGRKAIDAILEARKEGPFRSLRDFCDRVDLQKVNRRVLESLIKSGAFDSFGGHRAKYMAALDDVLEQIQRRHRRANDVQLSMFSLLGAGEEEERENDIDLPEVERWTEAQRLEYEKETLGFYVTGHPLEEIRDRIQAWANADSERLAETPHGAEVKLVGMKRSMQEITTKKGDKMAFLTLEDLKGSVEVICFPDVFSRSYEMLQKDLPICVRGKLEHGDERSKVIASEIMDLDEISEKALPPLRIVLKEGRLADGDLQALKEVLLRHRGQRETLLELELKGGAVALLRTGDAFRVSGSRELLHEISEVFGDKVSLVEG
jgi:DNA polymerase-3 subunit alpha